MKLKKPIKKVLMGALIAYLILGTCWSAYDSHKNQERFEWAKTQGITFIWERR